jgi:hypothetical protein
MGISSKWIKSLVGIRKQEKGHNAEKQQKGQNAESSETVSHGIPPRFIIVQSVKWPVLNIWSILPHYENTIIFIYVFVFFPHYRGHNWWCYYSSSLSFSVRTCRTLQSEKNLQE